MDNKTKSIVVVIDFSLASGRNFFAGIMRYARLRSDWRIRIIQSVGEFTPAAVRKMETDGTDGVIATLLYDGEVRKLLDRSRLPLVAVTSFNNRLPTRREKLVYVNVDEVKIGTDAAAYFGTLGKFMSYGSVRHTRSPYGALTHGRRKGFRQAVISEGNPFASYEGDPSDTGALSDWLTALPKPAAVFAGRDTCARQILEACEAVHLSVPQQISVLGVDNDETICPSCHPPLSSILPGAEDEGYAAAAELDKLFKRRRCGKMRCVICPTRNEIVERTSTAPVKPATDLIRRAVAYIGDNLSQPLSTSDLAARLHVSRRLIELRFREILGESVGETILRMRLERLAARIRTSKAKFAVLIRESGFADASYAMTAFKRRFGMTMGAYRSKV